MNVLFMTAWLRYADYDVPAERIPQLMAYLTWVPDPRDARGVRPSLASLLATAALTGARSFTAIA